jgi:glycosyltransferase involved in cell wall biosynthesis
MRISFILSSLWLSGGVRAVVEFANRLAKRGHEVALVVPGRAVDGEMADKVQPDVALLESAAQRAESDTAVDHLWLAWSLAQTVPVSDVVLSTHTPTTVVTLLATKVLRRGIPVWLFMDYAGMFVDRPAATWLLHNALRWHRGALAISRHASEELCSYAPGRVETIRLGLGSLDKLQPAPLVDRPASEYQDVLYVGDMRPRKGLQDFLDAAALVYAEIPTVRLRIVSKQPCTIATHVPHAFFLRPDEDELARLYATSDLFVSASWWEGLGYPPLEAMACATPVVMTNSGGVLDYARPGDNCLLVPARNPQALAQAMLRVLEDRELALRLSAGGPPTAAGYDWETVTDEFERTLRAIVQC